MQALLHTTVLLNEAVQELLIDKNGVYIDATFGRGGHSSLILKKLEKNARLIAFDRDLQAVEVAREIAKQDNRLEIIHSEFSAISELQTASADGILMDLGVSSPQIDNPERGFSFRFDGPLDMRMNTSKGQSAADWINSVEEKQLAKVIKEYGEERFANNVARAIIARRQEKPFETTLDLAKVIAGAVKTREVGQNPATRTFQAIRIYINNELGEIENALSECLRILKPNGKLVVISFHSLEDKIVKKFIQTNSKSEYDRRAPFIEPKPPLFKNPQRIYPSSDEVKNNPRSRSAVMRTAVRTEAVLEIR